jgi:amino-acid N-acetyltransferase
MKSVNDGFVTAFRAAAPYIHAHRGSTLLLVFGGELAEDRADLRAFVTDVALLHALGVRIVVVAGLRPQIDRRLAKRGLKSRYAGDLRITDAAELECVREAAGAMRVELEGLLSMGLPNTPMAGARIRVATGNFVTARPIGVIDGVDLLHTGAVRKVDAEAIRQRLDDGAVVILSPLGYSVTGETFNVSTPDLAGSAAIALGADKLVCLVEGKGVVDRAGRLVHELTAAEAEVIVGSKARLARDVRRHLEAAASVCRNGVRRAHLVSRHVEGGLVRELFTRDGVGTLVTGETFETMRRATLGDVGGLLELIAPLEEDGVLARRSREMLEQDVDRFTVLERDGLIVACAALHEHGEPRIGEIACVAVHPAYRDDGRAERLMQRLERVARDSGLERVFVRTTQTAHWFREQGYEPLRPKDLPPELRIGLDAKRRPKLFGKAL